MAQPTNKTCVEVIERSIREELRTVRDDTTSPRLNVPYIVYECPKCNSCKNPNGLVTFQKSRGYTNPFNYLVSCYKKKEELLREVEGKIATQSERASRISL